MRIRTDYNIITIKDERYLLPYGQGIAQLRPSLKINEVVEFVLRNIDGTDITEDAVFHLLKQFYEATNSELDLQLRQDAKDFIQMLTTAQLVDTCNGIGKELGETDTFYCVADLNLCFSGNMTYLAKEWERFRLSATPETIHQHFTLIMDAPDAYPVGSVVIRTKDLLVFDTGEEWHYVFLSNHYVKDVRVSKDGRLVCAYLPWVDDNSDEITQELFHAMRPAFLVMAQVNGKYAIHSASILYDDKAYLFSAKSGTGKSTQANLWHENYGTPILNGDLNLLEILDQKFYVSGLPWHGTSGLYGDYRKPLGGIIFIKQSLQNHMITRSVADSILAISQRMISPCYTESMLEDHLRFSENVYDCVHTWFYYCTKDTSAVVYLKDVIDEQTD